MKITVDLSDEDLRDVCRFTSEKKKGPAIRKLVVDALMMRRRFEITEKFMTGEWSADLSAHEKTQARDKRKDAKRRAAWPS